MSDYSFEPIQKIQGSGIIKYDSEELNTVFSIEHLTTGRIEGEAVLSISDFIKVHTIFSDLILFNILGKTTDDENIEINRCFATNFNQSNNIKLKFISQEVIFNPQSLEFTPSNEIVVAFNILNLQSTFRVALDTDLGRLMVSPLKDQKNILSKIKSYKISAITSTVKIIIKDNEDKISDIREKSLEIIEGFLLVARIADTCFIDWCSISIYEKQREEDKDYKLIFYQISTPKRKIPSYRGITNSAHSSYFYSSAYNGYKKNLQRLTDTYNFNVALEWYIEANIATILESQFLMLCTCLEFLINKHQDVENNEYIIGVDFYRQELFPLLKDEFGKILKEKGIDSQKRGEFYSKLRGLNRRSFKDKIELFLRELHLKYDDLFADIGEIIRIRNRLVHEGKYDDFDELISVFNRTHVLITRILLALLSYDHQYLDWINREWLDFNTLIQKS